MKKFKGEVCDFGIFYLLGLSIKLEFVFFVENEEVLFVVGYVWNNVYCFGFFGGRCGGCGWVYDSMK